MSKERDKGMSLIVKTVTRLTVGLIMLYGIYIISHGHLSPGGGFAGGVILALSFIHLVLAYGKETAFKHLPLQGASKLDSVGALLLLGIALLGFAGGFFFLNIIDKGEPFRLFSGGMIPLCNIAVSLKVGAGLFSIFIALLLLNPEDEDEPED